MEHLEKPCEVYIDNHKEKIDIARVSRFPLNRHWPGYQRSREQSELCGFVSFDADRKREIRIVCDFQFEAVTVRPISLGISPKIIGNEIYFTVYNPCQAVVEFDDRHGALHLFANPPEDKALLSTEKILYFPKGEHHVGRIVLQSNQTVYIEEGAVVYGEIFAEDAENICIAGRGILDQSEQESFEASGDFIDPDRPSPIEIRYSKNVTIRDIVVRDPFFLAVRPICCENVIIDNIKVLGCWRYNSDGIDLINCRHGQIKNCFVRSFDDSLCLKGFCFPYAEQTYHNGKAYDTMDDVVFENCVVWNEWGKALEVGVDLCAKEIKNCAFVNCDVIHASFAAMDISNHDYAVVHDIKFENIRVECTANEPTPLMQTEENEVFHGENQGHYPYLFHVAVEFSNEYSSKGEKRGIIHDILFRNIQVFSPKLPPSLTHGYSEKYDVSRVRFDQITWNGTKMQTLDFLDVREYASNITIE